MSAKSSRFYQFADSRLLGAPGASRRNKKAPDTLHGFPGATWHGNAGDPAAAMMGLPAAFAGHHGGRFFTPPDRGDSGKTTNDLSLRYLLVSSESSGRGSLSGTLRCDWLCGDEPRGFEGHTILQRRLAITPVLSTWPVLHGIYKRIPTNVCQKLRYPRSGQVFEG